MKSLDRLGRNYEEVREQWRKLTKEKGVHIMILDMPILDTRQIRDLVGTLVNDIILMLLEYVAQNERDTIRQRQAEGIAAAKARGVVFGRPKKEIPADFADVMRRHMEAEITAGKAAKSLGVSRITFMKWETEAVRKQAEAPADGEGPDDPQPCAFSSVGLSETALSEHPGALQQSREPAAGKAFTAGIKETSVSVKEHAAIPEAGKDQTESLRIKHGTDTSPENKTAAKIQKAAVLSDICAENNQIGCVFLSKRRHGTKLKLKNIMKGKLRQIGESIEKCGKHG